MSHRFDDTYAELQAAVEAGASLADAALHAGVKRRTAESWLYKGRRDPDSKYGPFAAAVDATRAARAAALAGLAREPLDGPGFVALVDRACRAGSVTALRLRWRMFQADKRSATHVADGLDVLDELARRRARSPAS